ncbi:acyl-CoA dehydrogenase family protein [Nostoc sp. CENA67]|uniref:Acyl-CoA dehydrogenase family protein n=1 Tax=Amazonocrinis nigriterrae CENA67 TaxID=2794033 RepID=A0A8J7HR92_9NOST|nr:acyl-CoA dehydrogenase family protein [Amazonocrinis nigriterrae]MBH8564553.1 acyl-CoA dehydrogenase family protein [Amazonocrinis nigriterrae CENA67]
MVTVLKESTDFLAIATTLAEEFAKTAVLRDAKGGTPTEELKKLRESGLLNLVIPKEYGGIGETWPKALKVVREIAKTDGSVGQLLGYHYFNTAIPRFFGTPEQYAEFSTASARHNWFWSDAANPRDPDSILTPDGENFRLNGLKNFATGTKCSDVVIVGGRREDLGNEVYAVIPSDREGLQINDDWNYIGQRQTESGSVAFHNVLIRREEILGNPDSNDPPRPFATLFTPLGQLVFVHLYLGIALGAFAEAKKYTLTHTRPWIISPAETAAQDPYIIEQYGNMWVDLAATISHADHVTLLAQAAWEKGEELTVAERGELAVSVASAKVLSTRVALDVTNKIFEVTGARSAANKYRFDRYWRNVRTHTLHDPVAYKVYEVGNWVLNGQMPNFTLYT